MNNLRVALHIVGAVAAAVAGGTVVFQGIPAPWDSNLLALASMVGIVTNAWLAGTSSGVTLPFRGSPAKDSAKRATERAAKRWLGN